MGCADESLALMIGSGASAGVGFSGQGGGCQPLSLMGSRRSRGLGYVPSPEHSRLPPCLRRYSSLKSTVTSNDDFRSWRFKFLNRIRASSSDLIASE